MNVEELNLNLVVLETWHFIFLALLRKASDIISPFLQMPRVGSWSVGSGVMRAIMRRTWDLHKGALPLASCLSWAGDSLSLDEWCLVLAP